MKSFVISSEQIVRVIGSLIADEVSRRFNRHFDFLAIASWNGETALKAEGVGLTKREIAACCARVESFFGLDEGALDGRPAKSIADWEGAVSMAIAERLEFFTFKSAARDEAHASHRHRADEIFQDAAAAANIFYGRRRLLSFVAPHSLMGFALTILTPNLQQVETIDARGMTPEALSMTLAYGDVLVATPTLWRYMMREKLAAPDNTMAVSFGEPMAPTLAADMRKAGFGVLRELYGSTETGMIGWRDGPTEPFRLFDHWRHEDGEAIRLSPDATERVAPEVDFLEWASERSFKLAGRRDGAVQIGAVNVRPDDVMRQLSQHPGVRDCAIRINYSGDGVIRLVAHIVLKDQFPPDERTARDIDAWCRTSLRQQERPSIYQFHRALTGK